MPLFQLLLVAFIQGVTEFLPVSSSGHLILLPNLTGMKDQGLTIDVAVHVGTLVAVIVYFWAEVKRALAGTGHLLTGQWHTPDARLALGLVIATIPVILLGLVLKVTGMADQMRNITVIGWTMLGFGLVLYWADQKGPTTRHSDDWTLRDAGIMGLWQMLALVPGTSRSGITITGGRLLGYDRESAARLSMLMSIPTILASGALLGLDVIETADASILADVSIAAGFSFIAAFGALVVMMRLLKSTSYTPYVIYRTILGVVLLAIAYAA